MDSKEALEMDATKPNPPTGALERLMQVGAMAGDEGIQKDVVHVAESVAWLSRRVMQRVEERDAAEVRVAALEARLSGPGRYLVDGGYGRRVFDTLSEAREWANSRIQVFRDRAARTGKWHDAVQDVSIWVEIEQATAFPVEEDGTDFELTALPIQGGKGDKQS
jgi:hypothetical protein